jgi:hypothetical protein
LGLIRRASGGQGGEREAGCRQQESKPGFHGRVRARLWCRWVDSGWKAKTPGLTGGYRPARGNPRPQRSSPRCGSYFPRRRLIVPAHARSQPTHQMLRRFHGGG